MLGIILLKIFAWEKIVLYETRLQSWFQFNTKNTNMYLLTKWEGRMGKYLPGGHGVRTERDDREPNIFPSGPT